MLPSKKQLQEFGVIFLITSLLYVVLYLIHTPPNFTGCDLCDYHKYQKVYALFKYGKLTQIQYPYYQRPLVPWLASLVPGDNMLLAFNLVHFIFLVLSVYAIYQLWKYLNLSLQSTIIGLAWIVLHWSGPLRYGLSGQSTIDTPLYLVHALGLLFSFKKKYQWFYLLTPLAILQKESFLPFLIVLIGVEIWLSRKEGWFQHAKHLIFSLLLGIAIQKIYLSFLGQGDQRNSILALVWHINWALQDPTRFVRWFAAVGTSVALFPVISLIKASKKYYQNRVFLTLSILSLMYLFFGIAAGEDMTRIVFIGTPFIITLALFQLDQLNKKQLFLFIALILPPFFLWSTDLSIPLKEVDYEPMNYVYGWALYYLVAIILFVAGLKIKKLN